MSRPVTQEMVFLYVAGVLPARDRRLVEEAYVDDHQIQSWFDELEALPDCLPATEMWRQLCNPQDRDIYDQIHDARKHLAKDPVQKKIELVGDWLVSLPEGRLPPTGLAWFCNWPGTDLGVRSVEGQLEPVMAADSGEDASGPRLPAAAGDVVAGNMIRLVRSVTEAPFGVIRIIATSDGVPVASVIRVMEFDRFEKTWKLEMPLAAIFAGEPPIERIQYYAVPANEPWLPWFRRDAVERLLDDIPETMPEERRGVQELLQLLDKRS
jgi:hypothetical protein